MSALCNVERRNCISGMDGRIRFQVVQNEQPESFNHNLLMLLKI